MQHLVKTGLVALSIALSAPILAATVVTLKPTNGTQLWLQPLVASGSSSPVVVNGVIYVGGGNTVYAVKTDGTILWQTATGAAVGLSVALGGGRVFAVSGDSNVYAFNPATGTSVYATPVIVNGTLFVGSLDGHVYAFAPGGAGADAIRRDESAPALSSLHPDMHLVPTR